MEFLYRTKSPGYRGKGKVVSPTPKRGLLAGLWAYVFGGATSPSYRTAEGATSTAGGGTPDAPQYKTAPVGEAQVIEPCDDELTSEVTGRYADEIEIDPREIHIYPAE